MKTSNLKTSYYVKSDFAQVFTGSMKNLEKLVEADYMDKVRNACHYEKINQASLFMKAKYSGSAKLKKKAAEYSTENCNKLEKLPEGGKDEKMRNLERRFREFYLND